MEFDNAQAIYLQIAEFVCDKIHLGLWLPGGKIPSVRELAISLEVNPNTIVRSYEYLQQQQIVYTKRGMGYFVEEHALEKIQKFRKDFFIKDELPKFFKKMLMLDISTEELIKQFMKYKNEK